MVGIAPESHRLVADKYQIIERLGMGGMADVWLARDERLGKLWAIKEIKPNTQGVRGEAFRSALVAEAHLMKRLDHPFIPRVVDILDTGQTTFVVMDYVEGRSLSDMMREQGEPFAQRRVVSWGIQLCDVLGYLHGLGGGLVYRDMKPANVIVREDDAVRLIDFGIVLDLGKCEDDERVVGTPGYAAPEQLPPEGVAGEAGLACAPAVDGRADVYALGATLYTLLSGHVPQLVTDGDGMRRVSFDMRPLRAWNPRLSEGLERIVEKATRKDPQERYQTMREMRYDLEHYEELTDAWRSSQMRKVRGVRRRAVGAAACVALGVAFLAAASAVAHTTYEAIMHRARVAPRVEEGDEPSEAERDVRRAMSVNPGAVEPYALLVQVMEDDYVLSDAEARRLQTALGTAAGLEGSPGYAQLCFDVGTCYLSYYGVDRMGGSVGSMALASSRAAVPWFERSIGASEEAAAGETGDAPLSPADWQAAQAYGTVAGFFDEMTRAGREGRAAEESYQAFWEALATCLAHENAVPDAQRCTEGMRARLCQIGVEALASPTYLAGLARAGITEQDARQMIGRVRTCLDGLGTFASSEEFREVYGPVFAEIGEGLALADENVGTVFGNPVARLEAEGKQP